MAGLPLHRDCLLFIRMPSVKQSAISARSKNVRRRIKQMALARASKGRSKVDVENSPPTEEVVHEDPIVYLDNETPTTSSTDTDKRHTASQRKLGYFSVNCTDTDNNSDFNTVDEFPTITDLSFLNSLKNSIHCTVCRKGTLELKGDKERYKVFVVHIKLQCDMCSYEERVYLRTLC